MRRLTDIQRRGVVDQEHGVNPELSLGYLERHHEGRKIAAARRINGQACAHKGLLQAAERLAAEAEEHFEQIKFEAPGEIPSLWWPFLGMVLSLLLALGDACLIGPLLQGVGIVDPGQQVLMALPLSAGLTVLLHWGFHTGWQGRKAWACAILGTALLAVGSVCWWRSDEIMYASSLDNETWHGFIVQNPVSTRLFVVALSILLPIGAGFLSSLVLPELLFGSQWHWRRLKAESSKKHRDQVRDQLTALENESRLLIRSIEVEHETDRMEYLRYYRIAQCSRRRNGGREMSND
jgi:hypothetical protein